MVQINEFESGARTFAVGARLAYQTPTLRLYGDVRGLTEGGSGGINENGSGGGGNPAGCGTNNAKDCPLI